MPFHRLLSSLLVAALCLTPWMAAADAADLRQKLSLPEDAQVREWVGGRTIVAYAVPHPQDAADKEQGIDYLDLTIQVVDTKTGEVVARSFVENGIVSDAMHFDGLAIDAADYTLAPGVRAFGLREKSSHVGWTSADIEAMRLFEVRGAGIRRGDPRRHAERRGEQRREKAMERHAGARDVRDGENARV